MIPNTFKVKINPLDVIMCDSDGVVASGYISIPGQPVVLFYNEDLELLQKLNCFKSNPELINQE